jgi:hypothetical protein
MPGLDEGSHIGLAYFVDATPEVVKRDDEGLHRTAAGNGGHSMARLVGDLPAVAIGKEGFAFGADQHGAIQSVQKMRS